MSPLTRTHTKAQYFFIMAAQCDSNDDYIIDNCTDLNFDQFTYSCTDDKQNNLSDKFDPDNNFYSKLTVDSIYFTEEQFKQKIVTTGIYWSVLVNTFQLQKSSKQLY